jgi:hypothetical protein
MKEKIKNGLESFLDDKKEEKDQKQEVKPKKVKTEAKVINKPLILEDGRQLLI